MGTSVTTEFNAARSPKNDLVGGHQGYWSVAECLIPRIGGTDTSRDHKYYCTEAVSLENGQSVRRHASVPVIKGYDDRLARNRLAPAARCDPIRGTNANVATLRKPTNLFFELFRRDSVTTWCSNRRPSNIVVHQRREAD